MQRHIFPEQKPRRKYIHGTTVRVEKLLSVIDKLLETLWIRLRVKNLRGPSLGRVGAEAYFCELYFQKPYQVLTGRIREISIHTSNGGKGTVAILKCARAFCS